MSSLRLALKQSLAESHNATSGSNRGSGGSPNDSGSIRKRNENRGLSRRRASSESSLSSVDYDIGGDHISVSTPRQSKDRSKKDSSSSHLKRKKSSVDSTNTNTKEKERSNNLPVRTVPSPAPELILQARKLPVRKPRIGLRVKVRFIEDGLRKKSSASMLITGSKTINWYGGVIQEVMKEGRKIRICYDDGTDELANYPDREIIIDDEGNGKHRPKEKKGKSKKHSEHKTKIPDNGDAGSMRSDDSLKTRKFSLDEKLSLASLSRGGDGELLGAKNDRATSPNTMPKKGMGDNSHNEGKLKDRSIEKNKEKERERDRLRKERKSEMKGLQSPHSPHGSNSSFPAIVKQPSAASLLRDHVRGKSKKKKKRDRAERHFPKDGIRRSDSKRSLTADDNVASRKRDRENETDGRSSFEDGDIKMTTGSRKRQRVDGHSLLGLSKKEKRLGNCSETSDDTDRQEKIPRLYIKAPSWIGNDPSSVDESLCGDSGDVGVSNKVRIINSSQADHSLSLSNIGGKMYVESNREFMGKGQKSNKPKIKIHLNDVGLKSERKKQKITDSDVAAHLLKRGKDGKAIHGICRPKFHDADDDDSPDEYEFCERNIDGESSKSKSKSNVSSANLEFEVKNREKSLKSRSSTPTSSLEGSTNEKKSHIACTLSDKIAERKDPKREFSHEDGTAMRKKRKDFDADMTGDHDDDDDEQEAKWVQCDNCQKWRLLPKFVDTDKLPEHWFCELNIYDPERNNCDAPEQSPEDIRNDHKLSKKKKIFSNKTESPPKPFEQNDSTANAEIRTPGSKDSPGLKLPRSPMTEKFTPNKSENVDVKNNRVESSVPPPKRGPDGRFISPQSVDRISSFDVRNSRNGVTSLHQEGSKHGNSVVVDGGKSRSRNRSRSSRGGKEREKEKEKVEDVQWVQCEKCDKWRKLASHINVKDLPDSWYCSMNTWNPSVANCAAAEDNDAGHHSVEYTILNGSGVRQITNKLSYRRLAQGGRQISERARIAESIFVTYGNPNASDAKPVPTLMYNGSSAFVPRGHNPRKVPISDKNAPTLFDILKKSKINNELNGTNVVSCASDDDLDDKETENVGRKNHIRNPFTITGTDNKFEEVLKDLVHHALGGNVLSCDELLLEAQCRNWSGSSGHHFATVRTMCTLQNIQKALNDLVHERSVEMMEGKLPGEKGLASKSVRYRRFISGGSSAIDKCRSMKISKPWKTGKNAGRSWRWDDTKDCTDLLQDVSKWKTNIPI